MRKSDLKFERQTDKKVQIKAISKRKTGKDLKVTVGSKEADASKITRNYYNIQTETELKQRAEAELKRISYNGYTGSITGFGVPQTKAGDSIKLADPDNPERSGEYLIEEVKVVYSVQNGFSRQNKITYKIA